jgi:hypothetical protein
MGMLGTGQSGLLPQAPAVLESPGSRSPHLTNRQKSDELERDGLDKYPSLGPATALSG